MRPEYCESSGRMGKDFWDVTAVEGEYGDAGEVCEEMVVDGGGTESEEGRWGEVVDKEGMKDLDVDCGEARLREPGGDDGVDGMEKFESVRL